MKAMLRRWLHDRESPFFHALDDVKFVAQSREEWLFDLCRDKRVLHLGFVDAPFTHERIENGELFHLRLRSVASYARGADVDEEAMSLYREATQDEETVILDLHQSPEPESVSGGFDIILLGEVLEHLRHPGLALDNLRQICEMNPGSLLCVTVPNAFTISAVLSAVDGNEIVHPDHYFYFSPTTLRRLLSDSGFREIDIFMGGPRLQRLAPGITKPSLMALCRLLERGQDE